MASPEELGGRLWQSLYAAFYVANWADIAVSNDYFAATGTQSPLDHIWSLSVEEQFYLIWPLLVWGLLLLGRGKRTAIGVGSVALAAASFLLLGLLASPGFDNTRAYVGTDTRAGGLLLGAALAAWWRGGIYDQRPPSEASRAPRWLDSLAAVGLVAVVALMATMPDHTMALYQWGLLALTLATLALVAAAAHPASVTSKALGFAPLRWLGERSYGIYLWHLPVIVFISHQTFIDITGVSAGWVWALVALGITVGLSAASWTWIEDPIRTHGFKAAWRTGRTPVAATLFASVAVSALVLALPLAGPSLRPAPVVLAGGIADKPGPLDGLPVDASVLEGFDDVGTAAPGSEGTTSCTSVLHVGDSSSMGMIDEAQLPDPADRLPAQYERVGVTEVRLDILGARSIVERYKGEPNGQDAMVAALDAGFDGCFVIAMGLNEAANVAVGGQTGLAERIALMQALAGDRPTMWITVETLRTSGPWANSQMDVMNAALLEACRTYPTMRVYDWAAEAPDSWFGTDRIHFTPEGDRERAQRIADALAVAFPANGHRGYECTVASGWTSE
jgi:peptidoglycan/LPS O-acetylase OafA/YrhL